MAAKKKKRMTQREKDENARIKKELQAKGILPPNKPRLNRKKFANEVWADFQKMNYLRRDFFLLQAIRWMVGPDMQKVTSEEVGVLKLLKLAVEQERFHDSLKEAGRDHYTTEEIMDAVIWPVLKL